METKLSIGKILYSLNIGNAARNTNQELTEVVVKKIGRKYFTCGLFGESWKDQQYYLSDWREKTDCSDNSKLYPNPMTWREEKESTEICMRLKDVFEYGRNRSGLPVEVLRKIDKIIKDVPLK